MEQGRRFSADTPESTAEGALEEWLPRGVGNERGAQAPDSSETSEWDVVAPTADPEAPEEPEPDAPPREAPSGPPPNPVGDRASEQVRDVVTPPPPTAGAEKTPSRPRVPESERADELKDLRRRLADLEARTDGLGALDARVSESARQSSEAVEQAKEFEEILSLAEGGWRQSVLDLRARVEAFEERVAALDQLATTTSGELAVQRDASGREAEAVMAAVRAMSTRMDAIEASLTRVTSLSEALEALEARLPELDRRARMGDELAMALSRYGGRSEAEPLEGGPLERLNGASFEQLRSMGLSVTQAARVIALRDGRRGFAAVDEVDQVPGLSADAAAELKRSLGD